jgi:hypothetical protein
VLYLRIEGPAQPGLPGHGRQGHAPALTWSSMVR